MIKEISSNILARLVNSFFALLIAIIISHNLGSDGRGEQSLIIATISIIIIITGIIGPSSITYLLPRKPFNELFIPSCLWIFLIAFISFVFLPIFRIINSEYIVEVCFLIILISFHNLLISIFTARQKISAINLIMITQVISSFIFLIFIFYALNKKNLHSYFISLLSGYILADLLGIFKLKDEFDTNFKTIFNIETLKKQLVLGIYNQLSNLIQILNFRFSYFIVDKFCGTSTVGFLSNAVSVAESIWIISRSTAIVFHSKVVNTKNNFLILKLTRKILLTTFLILIFLNSFLIILPDKIYQFLFGNEFINLKNIVIQLIPGIIFFGTNMILIHLYSGIGKHYVNLISNLSGFIILVPILYILTPLYKISGAIISTNLCYFIVFLINYLMFLRLSKKIKQM